MLLNLVVFCVFFLLSFVWGEGFMLLILLVLCCAEISCLF
jgi:hypothetical protein